MKHSGDVEHLVSIAASGPDVLAVIADFAAYPQWAAAVRSAEVIEQRGRDPAWSASASMPE